MIRHPSSIRSGRLAAFSLVGLLVVASLGHGHIVHGKLTLLQLVSGADVVLLARVDEAGLEIGADGEGVRPATQVVVLRRLKGQPAEGEKLRFVHHGHGTVDYREGDRLLLFLIAADRSQELSAFAREADVGFISLREHGERFRPDGSDDELIATIEAYVALDGKASEERLVALRTLTIELLRSDDERLAASAVQDLAATGPMAVLSAPNVDEFMALLDDESLSTLAHIGILSAVAHHGLAETAAHWARLIEQTSGGDLTRVIRAAGAHPSAAVCAALLERLDDSDTAMASEAAIALGWRGNEKAVPALAAALQNGDRRLRLAAIRGLERIGGDAAKSVLNRAAESHGDDMTRRRAAAAVP